MLPEMEFLKYEAASPKHLNLHRSMKKIRAIFGGNRAGKTRWGWQEVIWTLYGLHPYHDPYPSPIQIRICCVDEDHGIKEVMMPYWKELLPEGTYHYYAEPKVLEVSVGDGKVAHIKFLTYQMDLDKFGGAKYHLVWMDEEPKFRAQYVQNMMRTVDTKGKLLLTMTPLYGLTWAYDEILEARNPAMVDYEKVSIYDNKYLDKAEIEMVEKNVDPDMRDAVIYGEFVSPSGLIYKSFDSVHHIIDPPQIGHILDQQWMTILGIDTHESDRNPHAVVFCAFTKGNELIVFDEILEECLIGELAELIKEKLKSWKIDYRFGVIDISAKSAISGINHKAELIRCGIKKLETADKSKDTVQEGRSKIKSLLDYEYDEETKVYKKKPGLFVSRDCQQTIWEFRHYIYANWASSKMQDQRNPKEEARKKDDHLLDALRYVVNRNIKWRSKDFSLSKPTMGGKHLIRGVQFKG